MKSLLLFLSMLIFLVVLSVFMPICSIAKTGGYIKTTGYYFTETSQDKQRIDIQINLKTSFPFYNVGKGFTSFKFYADDLFGESKDNILSLDEAYLDFYTDNADIRLGKQYIFWGRVKGIDTPTNNINPWDYDRIKPGLERQKIAVDALQINYFKGFDLIFQGVWIPEFIPSKFPPFSFPQGVSIKKAKFPAPQLKNSSLGLKIDKFGVQGNFSFDYLYTWDSFPDYELDLSELPLINFNPVYHRVSIYGADFASEFIIFEVRGEIAYFQTEDKGGTSLWIKNPYLKYTFEIGYPITEEIDIIAQLSGKKISNFKSPQEYSGIPQEVAEQISIFYGEQVPWQNLVTTYVNCRTWYDKLKIEFMGTYNLTLCDYLLSSQMLYEIGEGFNLRFGAVIFGGGTKTQFGMTGNQDFIWGELSYNF